MVLSEPNQPDPEPAENLTQFLPHHNPTATARQIAPTVAEPIPCKNCGYDLRGLRHDRPCPECGQVHRRDPKDPYPHPSDHAPAYLKRVAFGLRLLALAWLCIVPIKSALLFMTVDHAWLNYAHSLGLVLALLGTILIAARSKQEQSNTERAYRIRQFFAILLIAGALLSQCLVLAASFSSKFAGTGFSPNTTVLLALTAQSVICLIIASLGYLIHDEPLAHHSLSLSWIMPLLVFVAYPVLLFTLGHRNNLILIPLLIIPLTAHLIQIPFFIILISLQRQFTWAIRYQAEFHQRIARIRQPQS